MVIKLEYSFKLKINTLIGCLRTRVRKQPIIVLYLEFENKLNKLNFYNLKARLVAMVILLTYIFSSKYDKVFLYWLDESVCFQME